MIAKASQQPKLTLLALSDQAHQLSEQLERGQSRTPFTDAARGLKEKSSATQLSISVLCLDPETTIAFKAWRQSIHDDRTAIEISECDELSSDVQAYQRFCNAADALVIAGSADQSLEPERWKLIGSVAELFALVYPVVIGDQTDRLGTWWSEIAVKSRTTHLAPRLCQVADVGSADSEALLQPLGCFREPLILQRQSSTLVGLVQKIASRVEHEVAYLKGAQSRLEIPSKASPARMSTDSDKELAPLRERFSEQLTNIDRQLSLKSDRSTQPLGELSGMMRGIAASLAVEDLEKSHSSAMLKLSVNASHLARINRRIEHVLRQEFVTDLQGVERQVQSLTSDIASGLHDRFGASPPLKFAALDINHAWRSVENLMAVGKEAHIELARKGFFDVLTAGRQKVFIIIMFASLMGRMGLPNLFHAPASKAGFGLFMAVVMIGSMINAVLHWRREKQLQSEKEMAKIRETLLSDGSKVIEQVEKVKLSTTRDYLKEVFRNFEGTVKQFVEEVVAQQRTKREAEAQKQEALRKTLDARLKQMSEVQRQIIKLSEQSQSLWTSAVDAIRQLADDSGPVQRSQPLEEIDKPIVEAKRLVDKSPRSDAEPKMRGPLQSKPVSALAQRRERRSLISKSEA